MPEPHQAPAGLYAAYSQPPGHENNPCTKRPEQDDVSRTTTSVTLPSLYILMGPCASDTTRFQPSAGASPTPSWRAHKMSAAAEMGRKHTGNVIEPNANMTVRIRSPEPSTALSLPISKPVNPPLAYFLCTSPEPKIWLRWKAPDCGEDIRRHAYYAVNKKSQVL